MHTCIDTNNVHTYIHACIYYILHNVNMYVCKYLHTYRYVYTYLYNSDNRYYWSNLALSKLIYKALCSLVYIHIIVCMSV